MIHTARECLKLNLKNIRKEKHISQKTLSDISGLSRDYLSEIERGIKIPSIKRLDMIAEALEIDSYKLILPID